MFCLNETGVTMLPQSLIRPFRLVLLLLGFSGILSAQLDPRLQVVDTDVLDVYKSQPAKPEMLTIFDFSGSMYAMYWHPAYFGNASQSNHNSPWGDGDFPGLVPVITGRAVVLFREGTGYYQNVYSTTNSSNFDTTSGRLVRPNGTVIPASGSALSRTELADLVREASHIRMKATGTVTVGGSSVTVTREIDLPIPWAVFDRTYGASAQGQLMMLADPKGGPAVTPDEIYLNGAQDINIVNANNRGYKIGRFHYNRDYLWWIFFGSDARTATGSSDTGKFVIPAVNTSNSALEPALPAGASGAFTWNNGLPGMTRFQALKYATVKSWFANQDKVWWAYRMFDGVEEKKTTLDKDNGNASTTSVSRDMRIFRTASSASQPDEKVKAFLGLEPSTSTPMTYALANAYAQMTVDNEKASCFGPQGGTGGTGQSGTGENPVPTCRRSFVILFTDGIANDGYKSGGDGTAIGRSDVYAGGADAGNTALSGRTNQLSPAYSSSNGGQGLFNIWTLSALAAHYPSAISGVLSGYAPFKIVNRGASSSDPRRIRTMTVGMSLGGLLTDTSSGKSDLFRAALYGNEKMKTYSLTAKPFDPNDPDANDPNYNPFFFDATDADKLAAAMTTIIDEVTAASASISAPSSPLVGLNLGRQAYLGLFQTETLGPVWRGDLLMAGIKVTRNGVSFLDKDGNPAEFITSENAVWSAAKNLRSEKTWKLGQSNSRRIYTTKGLSSNDLMVLDESNAAITTATLGVASSDERIALLRYLRGAFKDALTDASVSTMRDNALGDIVGSSPAAIEYPLASVDSLGSGTLSQAKSDLLADSSIKGVRFRIIFFGTNQGFFHAFGEVSGYRDVTDSDGNPSFQVAGAVDELWAFLPYEFLSGIKHLRGTANPHRYLFDGSPRIYFKDVPASGFVSGNLQVDGDDVVRVVVGLRKGGRSYFAFDVKDPLDPKVVWQVVPDSPTGGTLKGVGAGSLATIQAMGMATSTPALARVEVDAARTTRDLVFIGGGMSTADMDTKFGKKLGRSILAVDVADGTLIKSWDFIANRPGDTTAAAPMGSIASGVVPFSFFQNSGRAQRVYFTDQPTDSTRGSGLWVLGSNGKAANGIRFDSSNINAWTDSGTAGGTMAVRKVYQSPAGVVISASPAPFSLSSFIPRTAAPVLIPAAVGVAIGTGDRNDPMDRDAINPPGSKGTGANRLVVVFDRQDSSILTGNTPSATDVDTKGLLDTNLADLSSVASLTDGRIDPTNASYFLKTGFGYYLKTYGFNETTSALATSLAKSAGNPDHGGSDYYYAKVISAPVVLEGAGFFSTFLARDEAGACRGTGNTITYRLCNIMAPVYNDGQAVADGSEFNDQAANCSGRVLTFVNIAGEFTSLGSSAVVQTGSGRTSDGSAGTIGTAGTQTGGAMASSGGFAFRPKSWRIIR